MSGGSPAHFLAVPSPPVRRASRRSTASASSVGDPSILVSKSVSSGALSPGHLTGATTAVESDEAADAQEAAIARLRQLLRHPDDLLVKVRQLRRKLGSERSAIDAQLSAAKQAQLDEWGNAMRTVTVTERHVVDMQTRLEGVEKLGRDTKSIIPNYTAIREVSTFRFMALIDAAFKSAPKFPCAHRPHRQLPRFGQPHSATAHPLRGGEPRPAPSLSPLSSGEAK